MAEAADGAKNVLHGGRLAQHFGGLAHAFVGVFLALAFLHGAPNQLNGFGQVKGLGQVLKSPALKGADGAVQVRKGRHDDDRQAGVFGFDFLQQIQARAAGHADIADQNLRRLFARIVQRGQHIAGIGKAAGGQLLAQQGLLQHKPDGLVIVYDPNRLHGWRFL